MSRVQGTNLEVISGFRPNPTQARRRTISSSSSSSASSGSASHYSSSVEELSGYEEEKKSKLNNRERHLPILIVILILAKENESLSTSELKIVACVAAELDGHQPTPTDRSVSEHERRLDNIQRAIENITKEQSYNQISPVDAAKKQKKLLDKFKYVQSL